MHGMDGVLHLLLAVAAGFVIYAVGTLWAMWHLRKQPKKAWTAFAVSLVLLLVFALKTGLVRIGG